MTPAHEHTHGPHDHAHGPPDYSRAFFVGVLLNALYIVAEVGFGLWANSLALLADAGHNLSDVLGLLLAWGGHYLSRLPPTERYTYGFRSTSILAALANALLLLMAVGGIGWEAIGRLQRPAPVAGGAVFGVACVGVLVNTATALLFLRGGKHDVNIRGAFLHMAADAGVSLAVAVSGAIVAQTGQLWIDPAASLLVAAVIFVGTWGLLRESVDLAMHAVPRGIEPRAVAEYLRNLPGVLEVHDLHIWPMSTTETALTAHLVKPGSGDDDGFLERVSVELHEKFHIGHATLQLERAHPPNACRLAPPDVV